jgi:hypothetical protein
MPDIAPLHNLLMLYAPITGFPSKVTDAKDREALEIFIAGRYRSTIRNPQVWSSLYALSTIPQWEREAAEKLVAARPNPSEAEVAQAEPVVKGLLEKHPPAPGLEDFPVAPITLLMFFSTLLMYVALPSLVAALLFRGGLLLAMFGLAVVTPDGRRASRGRMLWRSIVAWSPLGVMFFAGPCLLALIVPAMQAAQGPGAEQAGDGSFPTGPILMAAAIPGVIYLALVVWSLLLPHRGLPDRIAGTYLVPR